MASSGGAGWKGAEGQAAPAIDLVFLLSAVLVAAAGLFGGASRENPIRLALVELSGVALLAAAARRLLVGRRPLSVEGRAALLILGGIVAVPLLQLIALPPSVWSVLPGQAARLEALRLAGLPAPWLPLSLAPAETARAALALIPPAAMLLAGLCLTPAQAHRIAWVWIGLAVLGLILGVAQAADPNGSPAYLYRTTNYGSLVGLFANRNHQAGFLLAMAPLAAALTAAPGQAGQRWPAAPWLGGLFVLVSLVALGVIRSRAGVILAAPAVLAALAVAWRAAPAGSRWAAPVWLGAGALVAAVAVGAFALTPILDRFTPQAGGEIRFEAWPYVARAAAAAQPFGSGIGAFDRVFEAVEPLTLVGPAYFNHAHNDYLELWLEAGWPAAALFALFLAWFARVAWRAWSRGTPLACAASAALLLLMAQSTADYPLRTETLAVFFAFGCGLLAAGGPAKPGGPAPRPA